MTEPIVVSLRELLSSVTFEGNMVNNPCHPVDPGKIADVLPQPAEKIYGEGHAKYKQPVRKLYGAGAARVVDPDSLSLLVEFDKSRLPDAFSADDIAGALALHFGLKNVPVLRTNVEDTGSRYAQVEIKLPLSQKAFEEGRTLALKLT